MNTHLKHVTLLSAFLAGITGMASASPTMPGIFLAAADQATPPLYGYEVEVTCATCHVGGDTVNQNYEPGYPTFLRTYYIGTTLTPATNFDDSLTGIHALEFEYAPSVAAANRLQTIPGNQVLLDLPILPGLNFDQTPAAGDLSALARITGSWDASDQSSVIIRPGENAVRLGFDNSPAKLIERGNRRRDTSGVCSSANPDYTLVLTPVNTYGFRPTVAGMISENTVAFCFTNIDPTAGAAVKTLNVFEFTSNVAQVGGGFVNNILRDIDPDSDPDTDPADLGTPLTAELVTAPLHDPNFQFSANGDFTYEAGESAVNPTDSFVYVVIDSEGGRSEDIRVDINIVTSVPGNNPPVAVDDVATVDEDSTDVVVDVLANDSDEDFASLLITGLGNITGPGSAVISADAKTLLVTPDTGSNADFSVIYQVSDIFGVPSTAELVVSVTGSPDFPTAEIIVVTPDRTDADPAYSVDLLDPLFVSDPDPLDVLVVVEPIIQARLLNQFDLPVPPDFDLDFPVSSGIIVIDPARFDFIELGEQAELRFDYTVDDGTGRQVSNSAFAIIIGTPNGPLRIPGVLADSLSSRYNGHFPNSSQTPEACLSCHLPNRAGTQVDNNCTGRVNGVDGTTLFNAYGLALCEARDPNDPPLSDLLARLEQQEDIYAPLLGSMTDLTIDEDEPIGTFLAQASAAYNGLTLDAAPANIVSYLLNDDGTLGATAFDAAFGVDDAGLLSVVGTLSPGEYSIDIRPVNDARQMDASFTIVDGLPGFFPVRQDLVLPNIFTITVNPVPTVAVDDAVTAESGVAVNIDVIANDTGGEVSRIALSGPQPANGTVSIDPLTNVFIYTADASFDGTDSFDYVAFNADDLVSNIATVTILVVNQGGLLAVDDTSSAIPSLVTTVAVLGNDLNVVDTGPDATVVTLIAGSLPDAGTVGVFAVSGQEITFTPAVSFIDGSVTVQYEGTNPAIAGVNSSIANLTINMIEFDGDTGTGASAIPELAQMAEAFLQSCEYAIGDGTAGAELSEFLTVCVNIQTAINSGENVDDAMRALRNEEHFAALDSTALVARGLGNVVQGRLDSVLRGNTRGIDLSGVTLSIDGTAIPSRGLQDIGKFLLGVPADQNDAFSNESPWGMFVAGEFAFGSKDDTLNSDGFDFSANNILVGIDYRLSENKIFGVAAGYATSNVSFGDGGSLTGQGLQLSGFGSINNFMAPGFRLDGFVSLGTVAFDSDRAINFTSNGVTVDEVASASFNSTYLNIVPRLSFSNVFGEYGDPTGDIQTDLQLTFYGSLDYLITYIGGYTETGGGGLNLAVQGQVYHSLIASTGLKFDRPIYIGPQTKMTVFGGVSLNGEFLDNIRTVTSSFVTAGVGAPEFTISEPGTAGWFFAADIGAAIDVGRGNLSFSYAVEQQANDANIIQRLSLNFNTRVGKTGQLSFGANQTASMSNTSLGAEIGYSQEF